ncbi:hypothetical protein EU79_15025, partial [Staphylococcus aureus]
RDGLRQQRGELRRQVGELIGVALHRALGIGQLVDAVERVEQRPDRRAHRDVVAVRFPVEVVTQRPELVVEVGDVVADLLGGLQ